MTWVVQIGLIELALGGLLGWAMVVREDRPEWLRGTSALAVSSSVPRMFNLPPTEPRICVSGSCPTAPCCASP